MKAQDLRPGDLVRFEAGSVLQLSRGKLSRDMEPGGRVSIYPSNRLFLVEDVIPGQEFCSYFLWYLSRVYISLLCLETTQFFFWDGSRNVVLSTFGMKKL